MNYQPFVSQIRRGLVRGWKCQISGVEYTTTDPHQEDAKYRDAVDHSLRLQHVMDRTLRTVASIETPSSENGFSLPTHTPRYSMSLQDRQALYASDAENLELAITATVGAE